MYTLEQTKFQNKSLSKLWATIIALLALIGLLNQSIGAFFTFNFYYLFGTATPLFFIFTIIATAVYLKRVTLKNHRLVLLIAAFFITLITTSALFHAIPYPNAQFSDLDASMILLGDYITYYQDPNVLYSQFHGGYLGTLLYTSLNTLDHVVALVILFTLLTGALILIFWPFIVMITKLISNKIKTIRHRNAVIRNARKVPSSQTISPLKPREESNEEITHEPSSYFSERLETSSVKRAVFGEEQTQQPISFNPVIVNINQAYPNEEAIDVDEVLNLVMEKHQEMDSKVDEQVTLIKEEVKEESPLEETPSFEQNVVEKLLKQAEIEENLSETELTVPLFEAPAKPSTIEFYPQNESEDSTKPSINIQTVEPIIEAVNEVKEVPLAPLKEVGYKNYQYPSLDLLNTAMIADEMEINIRAADRNLEAINAAFNNFRIGARAVSYTIGPSITRFDIKMDDDKSVSTLSKFIPDISIRLGGLEARFEQIIIGKSTSGYEVPNEKKITVTLKDCLEKMPNDEKNTFSIPFGKNIDGKVITGRIDEFPHLLVAGSTGSGKSVFVHSLLITLLMRTHPDDMRLLIVDPKRVEMTKYRDIPHLLCPIVKEAKEARIALEKLVDEMEQRYRLFEEEGANKLTEYNQIVKSMKKPKLPRIIAIIDEYSDLVESEKDISTPLLRLAQKSRAAGIHIVVATQRPSVETITGTIKANLPARVALKTASSTDSQVILGVGGAESLLGNGDMLVDWAQVSNQGLTRIQGAYVDNGEIRAVTDYLRNHYGTNYLNEFLDLSERSLTQNIAGSPSQFVDEIYQDVKEFVLSQDTISINRIQTTFGVTFNRAKPIYDMLMAEGIIVPPDASNSSRGAKVVHQTAPSRDELRIDNNEY